MKKKNLGSNELRIMENNWALVLYKGHAEGVNILLEKKLLIEEDIEEKMYARVRQFLPAALKVYQTNDFNAKTSAEAPPNMTSLGVIGKNMTKIKFSFSMEGLSRSLSP